MRFHDTATFDEILVNVCLEHIESAEDVEVAEAQSMEFALEHLAKAFGQALSDYDGILKEDIPRSWKIKENVIRRPLCEFGQIEYSKTVYIDNNIDIIDMSKTSAASKESMRMSYQTAWRLGDAHGPKRVLIPWRGAGVHE